MIDGLAIFPLHAVLFPGGRLPLRIFEQRYLRMAKECLRDAAPFGVCLIRDGAEVGAPAVPADVGCIARIASWDMPQLGVLEIIALGETRFRILARTIEADGLARAQARLSPDESDAPVPPACQICLRLVERLIAEHGEAVFAPPHRLDSSAWVSARLAEMLPLPLEEKQALLELAHGRERIERLTRLLAA